MKFCKSLRAWRKKHNLTQQMASAELSVAMRTYQSWEDGDGTPHKDRKSFIEQKMDAFTKLKEPNEIQV